MKLSALNRRSSLATRWHCSENKCK